MEKKFSHNELREYLFSEQDLAYKSFHSRLIPTIDAQKIIGVRTPILRSLAKKIATANWQEFLEESWDFAHREGDANIYAEEKMLHGFVLGYVKNVELNELFHFVKYHISVLDSWATVDSFCSSLKIAQKSDDHANYVKNFIEPYFYLPDLAQNEYQVRFALVILLDYFINEENLSYIFERIGKVIHTGYYVKMAKAWLLSICFIKYPEETKKVLLDPANPLMLDEWTFKKAIQKTRESFRVSKEDKDFLKTILETGLR